MRLSFPRLKRRTGDNVIDEIFPDETGGFGPCFAAKHPMG